MKAIELLKDYKSIDFGCNVEELHNEIDEAIEELEELQKVYVQFARPHIETYICKCGSLGIVGYLCSNKECKEWLIN